MIRSSIPKTRFPFWSAISPTVVMLVERVAYWITGRMRLSLRRAVFERLKKTLMVWIAVYPSVVVVLWLVGDVLQDWPFSLRVLGATALIVPIVANVTEPAVKAAIAAIEREWARRCPPARE